MDGLDASERSPEGPMPGEDGPPEDPMLRRSRALAATAFLLLATAALLPWWSIRLTSGGDLVDRVDLQLWDRHVVAVRTMMLATMGLVAATLAVLFVRLAAGSWKHEPRSWRRDLTVAGVLVLLALGTAFLWPAGQPTFWDTTAVRIDGVDYVEKARPGLGWWTAAVALCLEGAAVLVARRRPVAGSPSNAAPTTPK